MSILWQAPLYLVHGAADVFGGIGMAEFFNDQSTIGVPGEANTQFAEGQSQQQEVHVASSCYGIKEGSLMDWRMGLHFVLPPASIFVVSVPHNMHSLGIRCPSASAKVGPVAMAILASTDFSSPFSISFSPLHIELTCARVPALTWSGSFPNWAGKSSKLTKSPQAPRYRRALDDSNPGGLVPPQETLPAELQLKLTTATTITLQSGMGFQGNASGEGYDATVTVIARPTSEEQKNDASKEVTDASRASSSSARKQAKAFTLPQPSQTMNNLEKAMQDELSLQQQPDSSKRARTTAYASAAENRQCFRSRALPYDMSTEGRSSGLPSCRSGGGAAPPSPSVEAGMPPLKEPNVLVGPTHPSSADPYAIADPYAMPCVLTGTHTPCALWSALIPFVAPRLPKAALPSPSHHAYTFVLASCKRVNPERVDPAMKKRESNLYRPTYARPGLRQREEGRGRRVGPPPGHDNGGR
ncbi:hypothetical protein HU200_048004 [Digitaria exilis]|uniref:Uncharacterized protein n=1 Tax=Digitaria exilis TaxID=1010633 RepID=A0A835B1N1_9POAL|nr:hypothetical protein HU200_048004 [Digitaria exilis]